VYGGQTAAPSAPTLPKERAFARKSETAQP